MPTYQYACTIDSCGHEFEQFQSFTDDALSECPICAGRLRKVFGSVGVVFKGSGFYRNDSRESPKSAAAADKPAADKAEKKTEKTEKTGTTDKPASAGPSGSKPFSASEKKAPAAKASTPTSS